ncbi:hypothetical protein ACQ4PT_041382 [Festuca glaucescens]
MADWNWMMLDRFIYRRDDGGFPDESTAPLRASSSTSLGQAFHLAIIPAQPPAISRFYVRWPGRTTPEEDAYETDLAAAHHDLLLLSLTSIEELKGSPYRRYTQDHFICTARSDPVPHLHLKRLPVCTIPMVVPPPPCCKDDDDDYDDYGFNDYIYSYDDDDSNDVVDHHNGDDGDDTAKGTMQQPRVFFPNTVGLVRAKYEDEEEFTVAQLAMINEIPGTGMMEAEVCVLRSRVSARDDDGTWEVKKIPIQHKNYEYNELRDWSIFLPLGFTSPDAVITFNRCICWVNYNIGGMLLYEVFEEQCSAKISYLRLSHSREFLTSPPRFLEANRSVCVTAGGDVLKYITSIRSDGELEGPLQPREGFDIFSHTLRTTKTGEMKWVRDMVVTSVDLWAHNTSGTLPRNGLLFPLLSMDDLNTVHFMLSEELPKEGDQKIKKVWLVTIDLVTKMVNSILPYIEGDADLRGEDADMVKEKSHRLKPFLPSEFPKYL